MALFEPNPVFSAKKPSFSPAPPEAAQRVKRILKRFYPGIARRRIQSLGAQEINSKNWRIDGKYVLKHAAAAKRAELSEQARWAESLRAKGIATPHFIPASDGRIICQDAHAAYCLTRFEPGVYFGDGTKRWPGLLTMLRRLVDVSMATSPPKMKHVKAWTHFDDEERRAVEPLRKYRLNNELGRVIKRVVGTYESLLAEYNGDRLTTAVMHIDVHPCNMLFRGSKFRLLLDFGSFRTTSVEIALGFSVFKCLREILVGTYQKPEFNRRLERCRRQFEVVFPEYCWERILRLGSMDVLKRLLYIVRQLIEEGKSDWLHMLGTQLNGLDEIEQMVRPL
jgi:hypothetical protein